MHTQSGVIEHTMPTVLTLKYLMQSMPMNTERPPYKHLKTRLPILERLTGSTRFFFIPPSNKVQMIINIVVMTPLINMNYIMLTKGFIWKRSLLVYKLSVKTTVCKR